MPIEAAAQIFAWITYPTNTKKRHRERLADAIVLLAPREAARRDPRWRSEVVPIKAGVLSLDAGAAESVVKDAWPDLRKRILAGNMALPLIADAAGFQVKLAPGGDNVRSLNQLAGITAQLIGGPDGGDAGNVKGRAWGPSKPVLHLCAALVGVMLRYWDTRWGKNIWGLLEDPDAICELVAIAEKFRPIIGGWRKPRPTVDEAQQIEIRLVS
jgi:hypothetical protein